MAIDFPAAPAVDDVFVDPVTGITWMFNGVGWLMGEPPRPPPVSYIDFPAGVKVDYFGVNPLPGTRFCDGSSLAVAAYPALYAAIANAYGGDATNFLLPDCRGRLTAGKDNMGGTAAGRLTNSGTGTSGIDGTVLGAAGGVDRHAVSIAQMPAHGHAYYTATIATLTTGATTYFGGNESGKTSGAVGGNEAHPNVQPTLVCNVLITTGGVP
jgi:microcystin-dependent protein